MTIIICMWACYQVCGVESNTTRICLGARQPSMKLIKSAKINIVHVAHVLVQVQWITEVPGLQWVLHGNVPA
jgi:hypothetical protein